jgi:hypothetical protein
VPAHRRWLIAAWTVVALCLGACSVLRGWFSTDVSPVPFALRGQWISPASRDAGVAQFRKKVILAAAVRHAWVAVSADTGFEVIVNGASVGHSWVWHTTHPYQAGLSERGQLVRTPGAAIDLNFPREYQWRGERAHLVPTFFDITSFLQRGENSICVEVESSAAQAWMGLEGEIQLWSGDSVPLDSDTTFKAALQPPEDGRRWTEPTYSDLDWPSAVPAPAPPGALTRILEPGVFRTAFAAEWLRAPQPYGQPTWFETTWRLGDTPKEGWIRVLADRPYELFVNDTPVRAPSARAHDADSGEWDLGLPLLVVDIPAAPELLDPDEVDELFAGSRFAAMRPGDPLAAPAGDLWTAPLRGDDLDQARAAETINGEQAPTGGMVVAPSPELVAPKELARLPAPATLFGYGIDHLLVEGENRISVRVAAPERSMRASSWPARIALDGKATLADGSSSSLEGVGPWLARTQMADGNLSPPAEALPSGTAAAPDAPLPGMVYRGEAPPHDGLRRLSLAILAVLLALGTLAGLPHLLRRISSSRGSAPGSPPLVSWDVPYLWALVVWSTALFVPIILRLSWDERDDILYLLPAGVWRTITAVAFLLAVGVNVGLAARVRPRGSLPSLARALPAHRAWPVVIGLVLVTCAFLRAHKLELQPWEDDEIASIQAALAVAETGLPRYSPDVYYTRSPLYHYAVGATVRLLGANVWALRLPNILFATATAFLIYWVGARLLRSRWTGLIAAALYAVHPYAVYLGHIVRFYQPQQFFTLLAAYYFCEGFVTRQRTPARFLTVASLLAAVLSQELSLLMAAPLMLGYLLFAKPKGFRSTAALAVVSACAVAFIALDALALLTVCLTKLDGISPNVEATLSFHFANPLHFLTLFLSYSRLHLALSVILFLGLPLILTGKNRNAVALLVILFGGVVATNLLVTLEALRYLYWLFPIWLLLGVYSLRALLRAAASLAKQEPLLGHWLVPGLGALLLGAVVLSWSPWRMASSYDIRVASDMTGACAYVRSQLREGDLVAANEPQPPAAMLEVGKADYDISVPLLHDFVYRKNGRLIDRNASAESISTVEQFQDIIARHDRIWVVLNRLKYRSHGQDIMWQYPAARLEAFLRENLELKYQTYQYVVFLWDAHVGRFRSFRHDGVPPF